MSGSHSGDVPTSCTGGRHQLSKRNRGSQTIEDKISVPLSSSRRSELGGPLTGGLLLPLLTLFHLLILFVYLFIFSLFIITFLPVFLLLTVHYF